jgi:CHAT domain-containing protein/uncharacterized protein HemY
MKEHKSRFRQLLHHCTTAMGVTSLLLGIQTAGAANGLMRLPQGEPEIRPLISGQSVEREIAGGESHAYQISLTAGQFVRVVVEQKGVDVALVLAVPDGKKGGEVNVTLAGGLESLSAEAAASGEHRLTISAIGSAPLTGSYQVQVEVKAASAQDKQRLVAEGLLAEAVKSNQQGAAAAETALQKATEALRLWREMGDRYWEAVTVHLIGQTYLSAEKYEKAVESYNQALSIWQELKDRRNEAQAFADMASVSYKLTRGEKTIEYSERALAMHRELKDRQGEAKALNLLGNGYWHLRDYEKCIAYHNQVLAIYRELKDRQGEARVLSNLGNEHNAAGRPEKAIEYREQALAIYRELKDRRGEGWLLHSLGLTIYYLNRFEKALECFEQAITIGRELKAGDLEASALNHLASSHLRLGRLEKAFDHYQQALTLSREVKDRRSEEEILNNLGISNLNLSRFEKAGEYFEQVLALRREVKNRQGEAQALTNLGNVYQSLSRLEKALEHYNQALTLSREVKNRQGEGEALQNLSNVNESLSRYEKATENREQALAIYRELKDRRGEAQALINLGNVYLSLSRFEKGSEYFEQALPIFRELRDRAGEAYALGNLGIVAYSLDHYDKAIQAYEQVRAIFQELKLLGDEGLAFEELGKAYLKQGRYQEAIQSSERALAIAREVKNREYEGSALSNLGDGYRRLRQYERAIDYYQQGLAIRRDMRSLADEAKILYGLAQTERARGNLPASRTYIEESLRIVESMRADKESIGTSPASRASFLASVQESYRFYTDLLMRQHREEPTKGFDTLAVETSERQRARSLLDQLIEARADLRQGVDAALIERERTLSKQLNDKARQLLQVTKPEEAEALKKEVNQLETDYERAQAAIRKASPHYAALVQPQPLKLTEIQAQLDADTLLLEYALGEERSYLWAITKDSLKGYELPKEAEIKQSALLVYELLSARSTTKRGESVFQRQQRIAQAEAQLPAATQQLSQMLLTPVAAELGNKRLLIVADGALQYIPFAMLPDPEGGSGGGGEAGRKANSPSAPTPLRPSALPLIVAHEVVSLSSASALAIQRSELAGRKPAPKMLAVIADPVFDRTDARFKSVATEAGDNAKPQARSFDDQRKIEHLAGKSDDKSSITAGRLVIPRLPFTRQEAARLLALAPKNSSYSAMDFQASNATVLRGELGQYRYVHFATHGWLDSERPRLSALVLSLVDAEGKAQDGFLRLKDIYNLKLPAELVVLSACQTGIGKEIKGEGMDALTRGFMYAGAARVVVSLWSVNDKATSELMTKFYEKMLKENQRPAAALRAAQVEMWKQKQWQSPYYWAAFTLQGEWR